MKSYTDIEQSKKLVEILPIESADMAWCNNSIKEINYTDKYSANLYTVKKMKDAFDKALVGWDKYWELIPCWSLTALLNELPNGSDIVKEETDTENEKYMCTVGINDDIISTFADNPVDVCVEMIEKLHNLKMLQL